MSVDSSTLGTADPVDDGPVDALAGVVDPEVLVELAQAVWASFVDPDEPLVDLGPWLPETADDGTAAGVVVGRVAIEGPTPGVLTVVLPAAAALEAAARMFDLDPSVVEHADVHDATGEIANMVGGNVKALLSAEHRLGLPAVADQAAAPEPGEVVAGVTLLWGEHALLVTLDRAPGGAPS